MVRRNSLELRLVNDSFGYLTTFGPGLLLLLYVCVPRFPLISRNRFPTDIVKFGTH